MRHIVLYDPEQPAWVVIDTESAHMVVSFHTTRHDAKVAADTEEADWPSHDAMAPAAA